MYWISTRLASFRPGWPSPPDADQPDLARAFYPVRGCTPEQAKAYASRCVFMTVVRNINPRPIEHRLADWRDITDNGIDRTIRSKAEWDQT
jgi:hypothetical protein